MIKIGPKDKKFDPKKCIPQSWRIPSSGHHFYRYGFSQYRNDCTDRSKLQGLQLKLEHWAVSLALVLWKGLCITLVVPIHVTKLQKQFYQRFITEWPARSPDMTPCDFFLWAMSKMKPLSWPLKPRINSKMSYVLPFQPLLSKCWPMFGKIGWKGLDMSLA